MALLVYRQPVHRSASYKQPDNLPEPMPVGAGRKDRYMARIKTGPYVTDIRGRVLNMVYSVWKDGTAYVKTVCSKKIKATSKRQVQIKELVRRLGREWKELTLSEQAQWREAGDNPYRQFKLQGGTLDLIKGSAPKISGINAFFQANQLANDVGASGIIRAPKTDMAPPKLILNLNARFDGIRLTVGWDCAGGESDNQFVRVWVASVQELFHRQFAAYAPVAVKEIDITEVRARNKTVRKMSECLGSTVLIQVDVVDRVSGWASKPSATIRLRLVKTEMNAGSVLDRC